MNKITSWTKWDADSGQVFESDIYPETRLLVDLYYKNDDVSTGHRKLFFDIEVEVTKGLPDPKLANNAITAISLYDEIANNYIVFILDENKTLKYIKQKNEEIIPFSNEKDLLMAFLQKWESINPTIISGWNTSLFDIPYIYNRLKKLFGQKDANRLSSIGKVYYNEKRNQYFIAGVSSLDYLFLYKKFTFTSLPSYALDAVAKFELGRGKIEYTGSLNNLMKTDIVKFIEYNLVDTKLVVDIDKKLNFIELAQGICHKGHVPYEDVYYSSRWIEGAMLVYMKKHGLVAPNKKFKEFKDDKFSGAYVKSPKSNLYHWIYDLDLASMYPNIMISLNISPETKVGKIEAWDAEQYIKDKSLEYDVEILKAPARMDGHDLQTMMDKYKFSVSSNGILYNQEKKGIIPQILEEWMKDKDDYDQKMKYYGKKNEKDKEKYFKQRRTIAKTMLNSAYGVLALNSFRFYDLDNASAITETGVSLIKYAEKIANYYYSNITKENKDFVTYIDTDSIFISAIPLIKKLYPDVDMSNNDQMSESILKIATQVQDFLNKSFDNFAKKFLNIDEHKFNIKQEIIAKSGLWTAKKRYALWVINENTVPKDEIMYKGIDVVRSSFPVSFKGFLKEILTDILKGIDQNIIDKKVIDFKKMIKTVSIQDIAQSTSVKGIKKYGTKVKKSSLIFRNWIKGTPAHVKASITYNEFLKYKNIHKKFSPISNGEKVKWIYLKNNSFGIDALAFKGYDDPKEVMNFINQFADRNKMFERLLSKKLISFYDAIKRNLPSSQQLTINKFFDF